MSLMLEGEVDTRDQEIEHLRSEIERLHDELEVAKLAAKNAEKQAARSVSVLRQQLTPLYRGMQMLFGEIEKFPEENSPATVNANGPINKMGVLEAETPRSACSFH